MCLSGNFMGENNSKQLFTLIIAQFHQNLYYGNRVFSEALLGNTNPINYQTKTFE